MSNGSNQHEGDVIVVAQSGPLSGEVRVPGAKNSVLKLMAAFLLAAYEEDEIGGEVRTVLRLHPRLAPYKVAILPLSKKDTLTPLAREIFESLGERYMVDYDDTQSIGKRYRRQDEIGTPLCITVDFDSLEDGSVTIRDRDTTDQVRVPISDLENQVRLRLGF